MPKRSKKQKDAPIGPGVSPAIPEELDSVWDPEVAAIFKAMTDKEQVFLIAYLKCWEKAEAFRAVRPLASDTVAATQGGVMFRKIDKTGIWERFKQSRAEALFLVEKTYNAAAQEATKPIFGKDDEGQPILVMDQPDYAVRVKAAEAIARLHGLNQPAEVKSTHTIQSMTDDQLDAKIAAALAQAGTITPVGGEGSTKAHAQD